jgi:hypothetical protein
MQVLRLRLPQKTRQTQLKMTDLLLKMKVICSLRMTSLLLRMTTLLPKKTLSFWNEDEKPRFTRGFSCWAY